MILVIGKYGQLAKSFHKLEPDALFLSSKQINLLEINKIQDVLSKYEPDLICNFSAFNDVDGAEVNQNNHLINSEAILELGKFSMAKKIPIIHISTDYVFDGKREEGWQRVEKVVIKPFKVRIGQHKRVNIYFGARKSFRSAGTDKARTDAAFSRKEKQCNPEIDLGEL